MGVECQGCGKVFEGPKYEGLQDHICPNRHDVGDIIVNLLGLSVILFGFILAMADIWGSLWQK